MLDKVIVDTSVLVALIDRRDGYHDWVVENLKQISSPLLTCEAVLSETWFLLQRVTNGHDILLQVIERQQLEFPFNLKNELTHVAVLLQRYRSVPASLADSALIRMAEIYPKSPVFTLDSDFLIYRKNRDQIIPLIYPTGDR